MLNTGPESAGSKSKDTFELPPIAAPVDGKLNEYRLGLPAQAPMTITELSDQMLELFPAIDVDGNQELSTKEIATAAQDPQYKGKDAQAIAAMYAIRDSLSYSNILDWRWNFTKQDITAFQNQYKDFSSTIARDVETSRFLMKNINRFDTIGNDKTISWKELLQARESASDPKERELLGFAIDNYGSFAGWNGITRKTVTDEIHSSPGRLAQYIMQRTFEQQGEKTLYGSSELTTPSAVAQGNTGDCYFLAGLAALCKARPEDFQKMIVDNKDGTYNVTFPNKPNDTFRVNAPTEAELGLFNAPGDNTIWAAVIEKAFGMARAKYGDFMPVRPKTDFFTALELLDVKDRLPQDIAGLFGGTLWESTGFLTGHASNLYEVRSVEEDALGKALNDAVNGEQPLMVTAGIRPEIKDLFWPTDTVDGFTKRHAYAILGFDPKGPDGGTITVLNPYNLENGSPDGNITMSVKEFKQNFSMLNIEDPSKGYDAKAKPNTIRS